MSAIRRGPRPADRFVLISNDFVRDARLSFKARGIGAYLLSHAEGWQTSADAIAKANGVGRDAVRTGLAELESHGYLRRERERTHDGRLGAVEYVITCSPEPDTEGPETPGRAHSREIQRRETRHRETRPHKKTSSKKITPEKNTPSGGRPAVAAELPLVVAPEEHPMPDASQGALFDPQPTPEPKPGEDRRSPAQRVTAAFVDAHRAAHGMEPTKRSKGRVARDVKGLLEQAPEEELVRAAAAMGRGTFDNLAVQLKILRRGGSDVKGFTPPRPADSPGWAALEAEQAAEVAADPELVAWLAGVA